MIKTGTEMMFTPTNFSVIRQFILREGDQQTYCNMYNNNPHLQVSGFDVFLEPEGGQKNINCDPELGGFDTMVIADPRGKGYVTVRLDAAGATHFKPSEKELLEYYFAALISHISHAS